MSEADIIIPPAYAAFAKELLHLAKKHNINRYELAITPSWSHADMQGVTVKFHGRNVDGRGRPEQTLSMEVTAHRHVGMTSAESRGSES